MGLQITKIVPDATIQNYVNSVYVDVGVLDNEPYSRVGAISLQQKQFGGSFSVELENYNNSYGYAEGDTVKAFRVGNTNYFGKIMKLAPNAGPGAGMVITVSGELRPQSLKYYDNVSFSSATPFIRPDGSIVPQPFVPPLENHYRLAGLDAAMILARLSSRAGLAFTGGLPFSYPVWQWGVSGTSVLQAMDEITRHACGHTLLRFGSTGTYATVLPFLGAGPRTFTYKWSELLDDFNPEIEKTSFTDVILEPSSDMTPWNSTYAGMPQSIGAVSFSAGPTNSSDILSGGSQESTDWVFPFVPGNNWIRFISSITDYKLKLKDYTGESWMWAAKPHVERSLSYAAFGRYSGSELFHTPAEYTSSTVPDRDPTLFDYDLLYSWSLASKKFESQGDILPELVVVPGDKVPRFNGTFDIPFSNQFTAQLYGYGLQQYQPNTAVPGSIGTLAPSYYSVPVFADENCSIPGFAPDGTFYIGVRPNNILVRETSELQPAVIPGKILELSPEYIVDISPNGVLRRVKNLQPNSTVDVRNSALTTRDNGFVIYWREGDNSDAAKEQRLSKLQDVINLMSGNNPQRIAYDAIVLDSSDNVTVGELELGAGLQNTLQIVSATIIDQDATPRILVKSTHLPSKAFKKKFKLGQMATSPDGTRLMVNAPTSYKTSSTQSGAPSEAATAIEGTWTLFKFPRVTYTPTIICRVGIGQAGEFSYSGILPRQPQNPKNVSGALFTDYWRSGINHCANFISIYAAYLATRFVSFQNSVPYKGGDIPQPGDDIVITGIPQRNSLVGSGSVRGRCIEAGISGGPGQGIKVNFTCGRFESF